VRRDRTCPKERWINCRIMTVIDRIADFRSLVAAAGSKNLKGPGKGSAGAGTEFAAPGCRKS
jgi:hypothetical protein